MTSTSLPGSAPARALRVAQHLACRVPSVRPGDPAARVRAGADIMVHGDCKSSGCYAMTDGVVEEIYILAREAIAGGQES